MKEGETKTVSLRPNDAFGIYNDDLVAEIPKKDIGDNSKLRVGSKIRVKTTTGKIILGRVIDIMVDKLSVDFNHPLAGKNIVFVFTVKSIDKS
jgi:FKBP-type peptidyl-prolyl cis-trans isomerase 2